MDAAAATAYLSRIGYSGSREPTVETLRAIHRAHLGAVPFENLDIHSGRPIRLDRAAFFRKVVGERRGGFCYELNGLFGDLLAALGFRVELLSARVAREAGGFGPEFDHLVLLVQAGGRWLADVGFGRSFREPLSLDASTPEQAEGRSYRAVPSGSEWRVESQAVGSPAAPEYAFTLAPRALEEFAGMCEHHQRSPDSHFTRQLVCSQATPDGRVSVSGRALVITRGDERRETPLEDLAAVRGALADHFGIRLLDLRMP